MGCNISVDASSAFPVEGSLIALAFGFALVVSAMRNRRQTACCSSWPRQIYEMRVMAASLRLAAITILKGLLLEPQEGIATVKVRSHVVLIGCMMFVLRQFFLHTSWSSLTEQSCKAVFRGNTSYNCCRKWTWRTPLPLTQRSSEQRPILLHIEEFPNIRGGPVMTLG